MKVFVYGSLMKGYWNHRLLEGSNLIGAGILHDYEMYHVSSFPGIVRESGGIILGEVYEIDEVTLRNLDRLESEGYMYLRKEEEINLGDQKIKCFVYVWNHSIENCRKVEEIPWKPI